MAIEDEIINITDIDVGTEILNNDKLIIETNNGTKLLAFKDLVIGEDNITFKDKLVQGTDATGQTSTVTSVVTGYNILTSDTTAGHLIKYADISGTVELGKFNYRGVSEFAAMSATITQNNAEIDTLKKNLAIITSLLKSTDSAALNAVAVTTKAVNFMVSNVGETIPSDGGMGFDFVDLDPTVTNSAVVFTKGDKFSITYPTDDSFTASWINFSLDAIIDSKDPDAYLFVNSTNKATAIVEQVGLRRPERRISFTKAVYIKPGDTVTISVNKARIKKGATFSGSIFG